MSYIDNLTNDYEEILRLYLFDNNLDAAIAKCHTFSRNVIEIDTSPEEIVSLHTQMLNHMHVNDIELVKQSLEILEEVMISFGFTYRDYRAMLDKLNLHDQELDIAASLQETMLKATIPAVDTMQIGAISIPAGKVSGDYFNIIHHNNDKISFAVADVIGKGIPAAIAMTMLKFGMEFAHLNRGPAKALETLNNLVEQNVNKNMFITMFYGVYDFTSGDLSFSSAGHEPGFIYRYDEDVFEEIDTKGLVLGVRQGNTYFEKNAHLKENDMIFIFTDGVSELRKHDDTFIDMNNILEMIREKKECHPQDIVQYLYETLTRMQHNLRKDDLTMIIIKNAKNNY
ncbi:PP2C family protein-serine/threonine phosphatase [Phocicoccus pinnipedialis]|uniref:Phosphoserine phosphatase RsbU n=1 Tax=Phocicoccus pinnipedialis TaxID=110845 RepID=A0A6V7R438_9BACL|nr:PP2C family protein-serine/threonine phosphatase [Jeotgalicoccus pinnipedialis]MBP1939911.1 sigma-B regulation protein RsbU (phosphoserine phosphatase) [Jeotgalicoccus pinnipedialis]CAD2072141.1 Phosphoserine phosphatase RsbU [Jeotgalicoccus pinnipedialis]